MLLAWRGFSFENTDVHDWERRHPCPHAAKMAALRWPRSVARKKMTHTPIRLAHQQHRAIHPIQQRLERPRRQEGSAQHQHTAPLGLYLASQ